MKTAIVTIRREPYYRRAAVENGLKRLGYTIHIGGTTHPKDRDDLLVLWNKKRGSEEDWADRWEAKGGTVIVMENGYLQKVDKTYYALSVHGHNGSGWFPQGPEDRFSKLGFPIKPWKHSILGPGQYILVCGQRGIGSTLMASPPQWAEKMVAKLQAKGETVKLRLHPGNHVAKVDLLADLKDASWCFIWSSGAGVRALVEGINVHHHAPHWVCSNEAGRTREGILQHMAHNQWHHEEIATGEPFARMVAERWGPTWR